MIVNKFELFHEEKRKGTYKTWVFKKNKPCSADKMAEAGFIFTGSSREPDSAQCFFCGKSLDGWEASDDPWAEHFKHAQYCEFAKMQKPQDCWTLKEYLDLWDAYKKMLVKTQFEAVKEKIKKQFDSLREHLSD